jgi:DAACS family dicarboxylate/amino acid:cation (Na+ or H+) symporter
VWLLLTNTLVAIGIGLLVANGVQPGQNVSLGQPAAEQSARVEGKRQFDVVEDLLKRLVPKSIVSPFAENDVLAIVFMAIVFAFALRVVRARGAHAAGVGHVEALLETLLETVLVLLHWIFYLVPIAVFCVVASVVSLEGFGAFSAFGKFVGAVLLALFLQALWYVGRLRVNSWVSPRHFFKSASEALVLAFSTASSNVTLPVTYRCATAKMGLREENARLGTLVGGNLNNDGTALYEAMAALFIAQVLGLDLNLAEQALVVVMSVVASVGAAGIPEAGLVTMMAVFSAVKLPLDYIPLLLTVDWFLDRCRTMINVMGDFTVSACLDGKQRG